MFSVYKLRVLYILRGRNRNNKTATPPQCNNNIFAAASYPANKNIDFFGLYNFNVYMVSVLNFILIFRCVEEVVETTKKILMRVCFLKFKGTALCEKLIY